MITGPKADQRRRTTIYQYKTDGHGAACTASTQQVAKAEKAVAGQAAMKRNGSSLSRAARARSTVSWRRRHGRWPAGSRYVTNGVDADQVWVIGAYHQLWRIEHAFRMYKDDLRARQDYHHKRESIDAHLAVALSSAGCAGYSPRAESPPTRAQTRAQTAFFVDPCVSRTSRSPPTRRVAKVIEDEAALELDCLGHDQKAIGKDHAAAQLRKIMSTVYAAREAQDEGER